MPGWYFAHAQDGLNVHEWSMLEGTFSFEEANIKPEFDGVS